MSWFQLDPQSIAARARAAGSPVPSLGASIVRGIVGFTIVSVAGFIPWAVFGSALYGMVGEVGLYSICALVFIGLSAPALHGLIIGSGTLPRFYKLFGLSFAAYSIAWITAWVKLGGHLNMVQAGFVGLLAGTAVMGLMLAIAFEVRGLFPILGIVVTLYAANALGYFVGGEIEGALIRTNKLAAMLLWGVSYGVGFGAGLGLAFYRCQSAARALLEDGPSA